MKYKKIMLITFLLLAVVMIGTVSAEDNSNNLTVSNMEDNQLINAPIDGTNLFSDDNPTDSDENNDSNSDNNEDNPTDSDENNDSNSDNNEDNPTDSDENNDSNSDDSEDNPTDSDENNDSNSDDSEDNPTDSDENDNSYSDDSDDDWDDYNSYYKDIKSITCLDSDYIIRVESYESGNYVISVSDGEKIYNITHEIIPQGRDWNYIYWTTRDLNITTFGEYSITVTYIPPNGNSKTIFENQTLKVICDLNTHDEADINNPDDAIINIHYSSDLKGEFIITLNDEEHDNDIIAHYNVTGSGIFNWTLNDLDLDYFIENNHYSFEILFKEIDSEDYKSITWFSIKLINSSEFRANINNDPTYFSNDAVISVFCPQESKGNITVNIWNEKDENDINYTKAVSPNNWVNWTVKELGLKDNEIEFISIYTYDKYILINERIRLTSPINIETVSYIGLNDPNRIDIVNIAIPSDITNATIIIKIDGAEIFNENLTEFKKYNYNDEGEYDYLYWTDYNDETNNKVYNINNKNIGTLLTPGNYNISVSVITANNTLAFDGNINIVNPNLKTENNVTIEIYDSQSYHFNAWDSFIKISTGENIGDIKVIVTVDGETCNLTDSISDGDYCNIYVNEFNLRPGNYTVNVSVYDEENKLLVNSTASLSLTFSDTGIISICDLGEMSYYDSEIQVYFDLNKDWISGNITITIDGEKCYNEHVSEFDDDSEEIMYIISLKDLNKTLEFNKPYTIAISYYGDDGLNETEVYRNGMLIFTDLNLEFSIDDEDSILSLNDDNLVKIYPNDIDDFRIIIIIDNEVYLNATLSELNLNYKTDYKGLYYEVGPVNFNKIIPFGKYDNVTAYCIYKDYAGEEDSYEISSKKNFDYFTVVGILDEINYNETETNVISIYCNYESGSINFDVYNKINGEKININPYIINEDDYNKMLYWTLKNLTLGIGDYHIKVYMEDDLTLVEGDLLVVNRNLINPKFVIGVNATKADSNVTIKVTAVDSFNDNIIIKIGETELLITIKDGFGVNTTKLSAGDYNAILNFTTTKLYNASYVNQTFTVEPVPVDLNLTVSALNVTVGEHILVVITTNNTFTGDVLVKIGETNLTVSIINGVGNTTLPILHANEYTIETVFEGNKYFKSCSKNTTVNVNKLDSKLNITVEPVYVGNNVTLIVSTHNTFSGNVTVNVNNTNYNVTVNNGSGNLTISNLTVGKYNVTATFVETDNFTASEVNSTAIIKVIPVDPNLSVSVSNINYGLPAVIVVTTNASFTGDVNVKVDGSNYVVNVIKGSGSMDVSGLAAGSHSVIATLTATDDFTSSEKTTTFTVNNVISLVLKTTSVKKSAKKLTLQATLKVNKKAVKGKKIIFKFNGKKYTAKTNKKGVAKVTVKNTVLKKLKVGKKVTYTAKYSTKTVKKVVKVKK